MGALEKRTVDLATDQASFIDAKVAAGEYGSASEVVRAGIEALQEHDAAVRRWIRDEVVPTYEALQKDPSRVMSAEEAFSRITAHYEARLAREADLAKESELR